MQLPALLACLAVLASACAPSLQSADSSPSETASAATATPPPALSDIIGSWHRAQTCVELIAAFEAAGLAGSHADWITGNFFGGSPAPKHGDVCDGAQGPLEHSHFFTASGEFGSHDQNGEKVDDGDYVAVDADTLSFPSHASEFGYAGDLVVDYAIEDGVATFDVALPDPCEDSCRDAYAWALSAFASGPWAAGEVPQSSSDY
jgi:hypothetical protein